MNPQARSMKMWQWLLATIASALTAGITIVTFISTLVYSSEQGKALDARVTKAEEAIEKNEDKQRDDLTHIRNRIDEIYKILINDRSK